jgi:IclR family pca regulon transcriptional regulator
MNSINMLTKQELPQGAVTSHTAIELCDRSGDPDFMTSLARGLLVMQILSSRKRPSTISQLSHETGLSRAVVRRCLHTLLVLGCAGCERHHFFVIPEALCCLGTTTRSRLS